MFLLETTFSINFAPCIIYSVQHKLLKKERCQLLEKLDEYQDWVLKYALQDQDEEEIPPQSPENSTLEY